MLLRVLLWDPWAPSQSESLRTHGITCHKRPLWLPYPTLTMIFSVTYYLELRKATSLFCKSRIL